MSRHPFSHPVRLTLLAFCIGMFFWALHAWLGQPSVHAAPPPGKGGGSGGDGGTPPTGTIYFTIYDSGPQLHSMNPDGTNIQPLPVPWGGPSHELHGGHRWFITMREMADQTFPNGMARFEYFAVRDDGDECYTVQLTTQTELQADWRHEDQNWVPGDGLISFRGIQWDLEKGEIIRGGIYLAAIDFDSDGNVVGLSAQPDPANPVIPIPFSEPNSVGYSEMLLSGFSWSSDGRVAWASDRKLYVTDYLYDPEFDHLIAEGSNSILAPAWSPDNSRIAMGLDYSIVSIRPDGTDPFVALADIDNGKKTTNLKFPEWSPDGQYLICLRNTYESRGMNGFFVKDADIVRFRADGSEREPANLIEQDMPGQTIPWGWR